MAIRSIESDTPLTLSLGTVEDCHRNRVPTFANAGFCRRSARRNASECVGMRGYTPHVSFPDGVYLICKMCEMQRAKASLMKGSDAGHAPTFASPLPPCAILEIQPQKHPECSPIRKTTTTVSRWRWPTWRTAWELRSEERRVG